MSLLDDLRNTGVTVRPAPDWETNTNKDRDRRETVGIILHWDAIEGEPDISRYLHDNRYKGILYHTVIRRDGSVDLLSQRYVYHAGKGDSRVLEALRRGDVPPPPADRYDSDGHPLTSVNSGNPRFFSAALNYHPDEGPIPKPQYDTLVKVNRVLLDYFGLTTNQIIDHRRWTNRKRDIDTMSLTDFRRDVGATMAFTRSLSEAQWRALYQAGHANAPSEQALIDYWVRDADQRDPAEWPRADAAIITSLATKPANVRIDTETVRVVKAVRLG